MAGLLSDSDNDNQPVKKPVLRAKRSLPTLSDANNRPDTSEDSNPITFTPKQNKQPSMMAARVNENPGDPSLVSLVISKEGSESQRSKTGISPKKQNAGTIKFNDTDTDDLLGDLGLGEDDNDRPTSSQRPSSIATVATSVPSQHKPALSSSSSTVRKEMPPKGDDNNIVGSDNDISDKEEGNGGDNFSFGSYLPSVGLSTPARKPLGLAVRKGEDSLHNSFTPLQRKSPRATALSQAVPSSHPGVSERTAASSSTKKLVRFALQEKDADVGEKVKPQENKEPGSFQQEQPGSRTPESPVTTGNLATSKNQSLSAADSSKETVFNALAGGSETVQPYISPSITSKREGTTTSGRRSRRRPPTTSSSSRSLFESDEDIPNEGERVESTWLTVKASKETLGPKESKDHIPPLDPNQVVRSLAPKMEARAHDLDSFQTPTQSPSPAGLQRQDEKRGIPKNGELESVNLQKTMTTGMQDAPGVDDMEVKVSHIYDTEKHATIC